MSRLYCKPLFWLILFRDGREQLAWLSILSAQSPCWWDYKTEDWKESVCANPLVPCLRGNQWAHCRLLRHYCPTAETLAWQARACSLHPAPLQPCQILSRQHEEITGMKTFDEVEQTKFKVSWPLLLIFKEYLCLFYGLDTGNGTSIVSPPKEHKYSLNFIINHLFKTIEADCLLFPYSFVSLMQPEVLSKLKLAMIFCCSNFMPMGQEASYPKC